MALPRSSSLLCVIRFFELDRESLFSKPHYSFLRSRELHKIIESYHILAENYR